MMNKNGERVSRTGGKLSSPVTTRLPVTEVSHYDEDHSLHYLKFNYA